MQYPPNSRGRTAVYIMMAITSNSGKEAGSRNEGLSFYYQAGVSAY